jgi:nucleoid-associated protein YgaU
MQPQALRGTYGPLVVIAAAAALGVAAFVVNRDEISAPPAPITAPTTATAPASAPASPIRAPAEPAANVPADLAAVEAPVTAPAEPDAKGEAPSFDVVRIAPDGSAVVAGTAAPGSEVTVYADSRPIATATADAGGDFVAVFDAEPSTEPQALTLGDGEKRSEETVVLLPRAPAPEALAKSARAEPAPGAAEPEPAAAAPEIAAPEIAATAIVGPETVEVIPAAPPDGRVTLGSISYAEAGEVSLAGSGSAGSTLRAYVDGRLAEEATVGADGRWSIALDDVAAGLYTLRIDEIAADGRVASRVETPFQRDFPKPLPRSGVGAGAGPVPPGGTITVQPGNNLWTIARLHYGSGVHYTQIFTANRELIRDPELIYPGQIFAMPEMDRRTRVPDRDGPEPRRPD